MMSQFLIVFLTGLTTGGLSCLAVQGGLLASSVAQQIEEDLARQATRATRPRGSRRQAQAPRAATTNPARPILLFLLAKLIAYSLLGLLLGAFGSVFNLSAHARALLQYAIGIFMIGNALRMFNVHPIFRYFSFEPPGFFRRLIRKLARRDNNLITPLFLGGLTVFIPCGVTQAMMALAISSGSAAQGFVILSGFTLGTLPVFFALAFFATRLGAKTEHYFMQFTAAVLLVLGLVAVNSGLVLSGSPYSINHLTWKWRAARQSTSIESANLPDNLKAPTLDFAGNPNFDRQVIVNATNTGYVPEYQQVSADAPFELVLVTDNTLSCTRAFMIPSLGIEALLPVDGRVGFKIDAQPAGSRLFYTCSMGMYGGFIEFND
jgi:uncharacterized protein